MTTPRFLIDENLSPSLVEPAHARGFKATHGNHLGVRTIQNRDRPRIVTEQITTTSDGAIVSIGARPHRHAAKRTRCTTDRRTS